MACFAYINVSQGSVATYARCGGIFDIQLTTNLPRNRSVTKFLKLVKNWQNYGYESVAPFFCSPPVNSILLSTSSTSASLHLVHQSTTIALIQAFVPPCVNAIGSITCTPWGRKREPIFFRVHLFLILPSVLWRCWLGGRKGIRPVKNWELGCWCGCLSGARCRLAYCPADATATHWLLL